MALSKTLLLWTDPDTFEAQHIQFDAVTSETKDDSVDVTDHPVEDGSNVADNARDQPALITIEAMVSGIPSLQLDSDANITDTSITVLGMADKFGSTQQVALDIPSPPVQLSETGLIQAGVGALVSLLSGAPKAQLAATPAKFSFNTNASMLAQDSPRSRGRDAYEKLLTLRSKHLQIRVTTAFRDYENMMITRVSQPRATGDGTTAKFQVDLKQILIATSKTVAAPKPSVVRANAAVSKGSQGTKPASNDGQKQDLITSFGDFFSKLAHAGG